MAQSSDKPEGTPTTTLPNEDQQPATQAELAAEATRDSPPAKTLKETKPG